MAPEQQGPAQGAVSPSSVKNWVPIIFCTLFGVTWMLHIRQAIRFRSLFMGVMLVGTALELIGYLLQRCMRAVGVEIASSYLVASHTLLIVAPALLVVQDYIIVGRMMNFVGERHGIKGYNMVVNLSLGAGVIAIGLQAFGGSMFTDVRGELVEAKIAKTILLAGLLLQIVTFGVFSFFAMAFDFYSSGDPILRAHKSQMRGLRKLWIAFYIGAVLVTFRSVYRVAELVNTVPSAGGLYEPVGYLFTHEWPLYVFDAIPILISVAIFYVWYPAAYLPSRKGLHTDGAYNEPQEWRILRWSGLRRPEPGGLKVVMDGSGNSVLALHEALERDA